MRYCGGLVSCGANSVNVRKPLIFRQIKPHVVCLPLRTGVTKELIAWTRWAAALSPAQSLALLTTCYALGGASRWMGRPVSQRASASPCPILPWLKAAQQCVQLCVCQTSSLVLWVLIAMAATSGRNASSKTRAVPLQLVQCNVPTRMFAALVGSTRTDVLCQTLACQALALVQQGAQFSATRRRNIVRWALTQQQAVTSEEYVSPTGPQLPTPWIPWPLALSFAIHPALSTVDRTSSPAAVAPRVAAIMAGKR